MNCSVSVLGGIGEIGMNMYIYETDETAVIVDCGVMFADNASPGIDYIIPDMTYLEEIKHKKLGLFLTHGHEDHIGAVPNLLKKYNIPVYGGKLTLGILETKLRGKDQYALNDIEPREVIEFGDFTVAFLPVTHSISDTYALHIKAETFSSLHCSDFKIDQTPAWGEPFRPEDFSPLAQSDLTCLMLDSTNAIHSGWTDSESSIKSDLHEIFLKAKGRIFFTSFSSNIDRFRQVFDIARQTNRKVVIEGASLQRNIEISIKKEYLKMPKDLVVSLKHAKNLPDNRVCYIITGCQGETNSTLYRVASQERKDLQVKRGDLFIISARVIPGNERSLTNLINNIYVFGGEVADIGKKKIHVSGHASEEEVKMMMNLTRPKYLVPVHGEPVHLHAQKQIETKSNLTQNGILPIEDGHKAIFKDGELSEIVEIPHGRDYVDLRGSFVINDEEIRSRRHMCRDGAVVLTVVHKSGAKTLLAPPDAKTIGFSLKDESMFEFRKHMNDTAEQLLEEYGSNKAIMEDYLSKLGRRYFKKLLDRRPVVAVSIVEV
jgi:ribonuclease J